MRLRDRRIEQAISQQEVADRMNGLGFSWRQTTVAKTEAGERPLRVNELVALTGILQIPLTEVVDPTTTEQSAALRNLLRARRDVTAAQKNLAELTARAREAAKKYERTTGGVPTAEQVASAILGDES